MSLNAEQVMALAKRYEADRRRAERLVSRAGPLAVDAETRRDQCREYARTTGRRCQLKALANGRCRRHGGVTHEEQTMALKKRLLEEHRRFRDQGRNRTRV